LTNDSNAKISTAELQIAHFNYFLLY